MVREAARRHRPHPEVQGEQHSLPGEAWVGSFLFCKNCEILFGLEGKVGTTNDLLVSSGRGEDGARDVEQAHGEGEKNIGGEHGEC